MDIYTYTSSEFELLHLFLHEELNTHIYYDLNLNEDYLLYIVDDKVAALTQISTIHQKDNGLFTYDIEIIHITEPYNRIDAPTTMDSHDSSAIELNYEQQVELIHSIQMADFSLSFYLANAEHLYSLEKETLSNKRVKTKVVDKFPPPTSINIGAFKNPHTKAQYMIKEIANIIGDGIEPFIARNDQNREVKGQKLSDNSIASLPRMGLNDQLYNHLSLIDVIWFKDNNPYKIFECELSTLPLGILRTADFILSVESTQAEIYIVTTKDKQRKIIKELNRPVFVKLGISRLCKVIFLEDLENLYSAIKLFKGHIKPSILDSITYDYEDLRNDLNSETHLQINY